MERNNFNSNLESLQKSLKGVVDYIEANPKSEPNAYEMMDNIFSYYRLRKEANGKNVDGVNEVAQLHNIILAKRLPQLRSNAFNNDGRLYNLFNMLITNGECKQGFNNVLGESLEAQDLFRRLCGVDFYIRQRVIELNSAESFDENAIVYDNDDEFEGLRECFFDPKYQEADINWKAALNIMEHISYAYLHTIHEFNEFQNEDFEPFSLNEKYR
jgi:hypothetical protein